MGAKKYSAYKKKKSYTDQEKTEFRLKAKAQMDSFVRSAANDIVRLITEDKTSEWQKGWKMNPAYGLPKNPVSGHTYTRANLLLLTLAMMGNDWQDARFCSFAQAKKIGEDTHVMEGGKSITVLRPIVIDKKDADEENSVEEFAEGKKGSAETDDNKKIVFFRPYRLFHASQIKNMPDPDDYFDPIDWETNNVVEALVETAGVSFQSGSNRAAYSPARDMIRMPDKRAFVDAAEYYGTLLHEFYHSTGHESRENRLESHLSQAATGLREQAMEELRAQLFSVMAARALGLPHAEENSARYVNFWNQQCEDNPQEILTQATKAAETLQTVMQFIQGQQPDAKWFPDKSTWPEEALKSDNFMSGSEAGVDQFLREMDTFLSVEKDADGNMVLTSQELTNENIDEGFRIKDLLQEKFGSDVDVVVESQDEKVVVTVKNTPPEMDADNELSLR
jgi:antirestriction protein ArdC